MDEPLIVYTSGSWVQCAATLRALKAAGIAHVVVELESAPEELARLKNAGYLQAPVVEGAGRKWWGFRPDMIDQVAKERAGQ